MWKDEKVNDGFRSQKTRRRVNWEKLQELPSAGRCAASVNSPVKRGVVVGGDSLAKQRTLSPVNKCNGDNSSLPAMAAPLQVRLWRNIVRVLLVRLVQRRDRV